MNYYTCGCGDLIPNLPDVYCEECEEGGSQ